MDIGEMGQVLVLGGPNGLEFLLEDEQLEQEVEKEHGDACSNDAEGVGVQEAFSEASNE